MRSFNRGSILILGFVLMMLAVDLGQMAYRFMQPTDGWTLNTEPDSSPFQVNALGAASPILPRDNLIAVEDLDIAALSLSIAQDLRPANWQAGQTVRYRVQRAGEELDLEVPLYHWTVGAVLRTMATPFSVLLFLLFVLGGYVFRQRSSDWGARAFFVFAASLFCMSLSAPAQTVDSLLPTWPLTMFYNYLAWGWWMMPSFLLLALSFPRPKRFMQRYPAWVTLGIFGSTPALVLATGDAGIGWLTVIGFALLSLAAVVHSVITTKDAISRAQVRWAATGVVIGAVTLTLNNVAATYFAFNTDAVILPSFVEKIPFVPIGFSCIALGFAIAILRYRLFDIDVIIRRTLLYSLLTGLLALVYFGAVTVLQNLFQAASGQTSTAAIVISTLGIATLFNPLRRRLQEIIDRRFYRQKYNAEQALADFAATARSQTDIQQLSTELAGLTQETLHPQQVTIWLRKVERQ